MTNIEKIRAEQAELFKSSGISNTFVCYEALNIIAKYAKQEPKWIPVSEKLPKSNGVYIVSRQFNDGFEERILTDACYFDGTNTWHDDNRINHDREYADKKIVAWMPLPEPYKQ